MKSPVPGRALTLVALVALALGSMFGCSKPAAKAVERRTEPESEAPSAAEKNRELEDKAAGYQDRFREIQGSDMTAEEKAQAAGDLVDEQQRTVREAEDGPAGEASEDPQQ